MPQPQKIFVRFIDGTDVFIPIVSKPLGRDIFELLPDPEFDYDDATILFEYGAGDKVKAKLHRFQDGSSGLVAAELVEPGDQRNKAKRELFNKVQMKGHY